MARRVVAYVILFATLVSLAACQSATDPRADRDTRAKPWQGYGGGGGGGEGGSM